MKINRISLSSLAVAILLVLPLLVETVQADPVRCAGCKTEHFLIQHLAAPYEALSGVKLLPGGSGNKKAILLFVDGKINFAYTCKPHVKLAKKFKLDPAATANWVSTAIAKDPIVVVANSGCGITDLTLDQLKGIFSGSIQNWNEVGGADLPIIVAHLDDSVESGVVTVFKETTVGAKANLNPLAKKLKSPPQLGSFAKATAGATTFMGLNSYEDKFGTLVSINGANPDVANVVNGSYPLSVTYHVVYDPTQSSEAEGFLGFCATQQGQDLINEMMVAIPQKNVVLP
ncbi:MAG: substrate-binding domain-containing protein [Gemmatimonadales bacterium]|nr:substrate-binding domain-containing protein [Gemmatimonadales bacterium]